MKLLHLSDLHVREDNSDNKEIIEVFNKIGKEYKVLITGDLTDNGYEKEYENLFNILNPFRERLFICPGNHDYGWKGNSYSKDSARRFDKLAKNLIQTGQFIDKKPVVNTFPEEKIVIIALNSCLETCVPWDFACGEIGGGRFFGQMPKLNNLLNYYSDCKIIVMLHHHPFLTDRPFTKLIDADNFLRTIYNRCSVVCFGHEHEELIHQNKGTWFSAADSTRESGRANEIIIENDKIFVNSVSLI